jgi:hypothetical protein
MFWNQNPTLNLILREIQGLKQEIKNMATSTGAGLSALEQADTDLATAVTTETTVTSAAIAAIQASLQSLGSSEDTTVASEAAKIEAQIALINTSNTNLATAVASIPTPAASTTSDDKKSAPSK